MEGHKNERHTRIFRYLVSETFYILQPKVHLIAFDKWQGMLLYKLSELLQREHRRPLLSLRL